MVSKIIVGYANLKVRSRVDSYCMSKPECEYRLIREEFGVVDAW